VGGCMSCHPRFASSLIGLVAALAAAASGAAATPTKGSWATAANSICRTGNAAVRKLPKITAQTYLADLSATIRIAAWEDGKLAVIPRPPSEVKMITSFLATSQKAEGVLEQVGSAVVRGDKASLKPLLAEGAKLGAQYNRQALALGARVCAQNPTPSG
jgi:hypothetical protein